MSDGPTIGDWTQYEWIPDDASSFPARIRLRDAAWMVYYEPDVSDIKAENAALRKENDTLTRRIDELCAENERLRQENQSIGVAAYELGRKSMADENAKLREER